MDKSKWEYKKLGEVCEVLDKFRKPVTKSDRVAGQYPYYGATGIQDYVADYIFDGRYLLLGEDGAKWGANENSAFIIEGKSWVNNHAHILKIDDSFMDIFVMYYLNHKDLSEYITGAVVPKLTQAAMLKIPVPNISIADQQRIVAELDCLNEMIALKQEQLKEFDKLAQSIFYDMFGDIMLNDKAWPVHKWKELFETKLGKMLDKKKQNEGDTSLPYLANANVLWGRFDLKDLKTMTFNEKEMDVFSLKKNDLLICEGGESGRCAIWMEEKTDIKFQKAIHRARIKDKSLIIPLYAMYYMKEIKGKGGLKNYVSKATIEHLTGEKLNQVPVPLPPLALQQQFAEKIQAIEAQKELVKQSIAETQQLLDSRMDYYFN